MSSDLYARPLEECLDALIDYRGKTPEKTSFGIPLITAKIIKNGRIETPTEFIAIDNYDSWMRRGIPKAGDVVLTVEAPLGEVAQLGPEKIALAQRVVTLRGKTGILDNTYLLYLLQTEEIQEKLKARATGTTVLGIKQSELRKVSVTLPPIVDQINAATTLKTLDDRITLLRETNTTLEAIAQALFKSWFVDFDPVRAKQEGRTPEGMDEATASLFPDSFEESELGLIPNGWSVGSLSTLMDIAGGTQPAANEFIDIPKKGFIRLIQIRDYETDSHLTFVPETSKLRTTTKEDIMIARYGASVGRICWGLEGAYNVALVKVVCELNMREFLRTYLQTNVFQARLAAISGRSAQAGFNKNDIASFKLAIPQDSLFSAYQSLIWPLREKILHNRQQATSLVLIRDTLLPCLISGKLRLPETESAIEEVH